MGTIVTVLLDRSEASSPRFQRLVSADRDAGARKDRRWAYSLAEARAGAPTIHGLCDKGLEFAGRDQHLIGQQH